MLSGEAGILQRLREELPSAQALEGLVLELPRQRPRPVEVTLRGVDSSIPVEDVLDDLRAQLGAAAVLGVRRLHSRTEGALDRSRPLPVCVATLADVRASELLVRPDFCLFGSLRVRVGRGRERRDLPQCPRCFSWGHRAGACRALASCLRCGREGHSCQSCPEEQQQQPRCFACGGPHHVTYRGCPEHGKARRLAAQPRTQPQPLNRPQPEPQPQPQQPRKRPQPLQQQQETLQARTKSRRRRRRRRGRPSSPPAPAP